MVKYALVSDLHLDTYTMQESHDVLSSIKQQCLDQNIDVLLIAGDIHPYPGVRSWVFNQLKDIPVVCHCLGNHDYYGGELHNSFGCVHGKDKILHATLWTDTSRIQQGVLNDHYQIKNFSNDRTYAYYQHNLQYFVEHQENTKIIMTHHCPTQGAVDPLYKGDMYNDYFVNHLDETYISQFNDLQYWVYGHTHWKHEFTQYGVKFICNPLGYPGENYTDVKDYKVMTFETT